VSPTVSGLSYAQFQIRGIYMTGSRPSPVDTVFHRANFTITCLPERTYFKSAGGLSWGERLCIAILDYRTHIAIQGNECFCPASPLMVDVRGEIRGHPVHERITKCLLCGATHRAAHDALGILLTHPPV
jgi:diadenosine tetraphosphatase ApaH/serine/threonine PP2A family protein phosphatase